jgi:signal transduction histidine kinase
MDCVCNIEAEPIIQDADKETHVYRIAQEAVNNALKHGKPRQISIHLKRLSDDRCLMIIQDDGIGISPRKAKRRGGIGVRVMSYRANLIGGELDITPSHQGGTEVSCRFPCAY